MLPRITSRFLTSIWAMRPDVWASFWSQLQAANVGKLAVRADMMDEVEPDEDDLGTYCEEGGEGIALLRIDGALGKHLSGLEMACGGCSVDQLSADVAALAADANVRAVILAINSPGGEVTGIPELAAQIAKLSAAKPCFAFTDAQACSAAYWVGSQASGGFYATPSSAVGCVGTYCAAVDSSVQWANEGLKLELFRAGSLKAIGLPGKPFTDEERAFLQADVNRVNASFLAAVNGARPGIAAEDLQGQWFDGATAVEKKLADRVVNSLDELLIEVSEMLMVEDFAAAAAKS